MPWMTVMGLAGHSVGHEMLDTWRRWRSRRSSCRPLPVRWQQCFVRRAVGRCCKEGVVCGLTQRSRAALAELTGASLQSTGLPVRRTPSLGGRLQDTS